MDKIATAILFDVGCRKLTTSDDSFFAQSKRCLSRLILRKMFSKDNDELGVILFGSEVTENCMPESEQDNYESIRELNRFGKPDFKLYNAVESVKQCKGYRSDWVRGMIVALEYLRKGIQGKRFKSRQIVIFSEFPSILDYGNAMYATIAGCMKDLKVNLTIVGPDLEDNDHIPDNIKPLLQFLELIEDPLKLTIDELAGSLKYFEKKRKTKRVFNVDLEIGSKIKIPVGWVKLTSESQRFTDWVSRQYVAEKMDTTSETTSASANIEDDQKALDNMEVEETEISSAPSRLRVVEVEDIFKVTKFGNTEVTLSAADLQALKRESGPPSFKILAFTKKNLINPTLYVGEDIFGVMPRDKSNHSQVKLYALIDAMKEANKVAIARRIVMRNGKIQLGVLIPFSDECGKHMYFLKLPTAEWAQPYPRNRGYPKVEQPVKDCFKELIETMKLPTDLVEEGQGLLVPNPHFQLRCQLFAERAADPSYDITVAPDYVQNIINPCPEFHQTTEEIAQSIVKALPMLSSLLRKEATEKRSEKRSARKALANVDSSSKMKAENSSSFHTAKTENSVEKQSNLFIKDEVEEEDDEDFQQFHGLIEKLAKDVDLDATDMLQQMD